MKIKAEIVADSLSPQGDRLTSFLITFPRIILAEINTHRMLSKNTSSSRAIPFSKMIEAVKENPFIPIAWQKEHKGMQGNEYLHILEAHIAKEHWLKARDNAILEATLLNRYKVTKQLCNRLLEPFMWTTMLITGSKEGWDNFFELRCPKYEVYIEPFGAQYCKSKKEVINSVHENELSYYDKYTELDWLKENKGQAEIHIMDLAEKIYDAMCESIPNKLKAGQWHIPFENKVFNDFEWHKIETLYNVSDKDIIMNRVKISTAMAARTSYTVIGDEKEVDYYGMIKLHDRLIAQNPPHSSPMEHCARAMSDEEYYSHVKGQVPSTKDEWGYLNYEYYPKIVKAMFEDDILGENPNNGDRYGWCRNFKGFIQYRHIIEGGK